MVGYPYQLLLERSKQRRLDTFLVFPGRRDPRLSTTIRTAWAEVLEKAEIEDFRFHDLRHSFGSEMNMDGATDQQLRTLMGHKSSRMTARCTHMSTEHCAMLVEEMNDRIFASEKQNEQEAK